MLDILIGGISGYGNVVLMYIYLMTNEIEHILTCLLASSTSLVKCLNHLYIYHHVTFQALYVYTYIYTHMPDM